MILIAAITGYKTELLPVCSAQDLQGEASRIEGRYARKSGSLLWGSDTRQIVWRFDRNLKADLLLASVKALVGVVPTSRRLTIRVVPPCISVFASMNIQSVRDSNIR